MELGLLPSVIGLERLSAEPAVTNLAAITFYPPSIAFAEVFPA